MAVELSYDSTGITAAPPRPIVTVEVGGPRSFYDVTPDGQRFLVNSVLDRTAAPPITLIVNWPSLLDPSR